MWTSTEAHAARMGEADETTINYGWVKPDRRFVGRPMGRLASTPISTASTALFTDSLIYVPTPTIPPGTVVSDTAPASPQVVGQEWFDGVSGQLYVWYDDGNSGQWVIAVNAAASLLPASTTVLGGVKVDGTTIKAAPDGTISTTVVPMGDNRIINGDMRIDQRNGGASGTALNAFPADRWFYNSSSNGHSCLAMRQFQSGWVS